MYVLGGLDQPCVFPPIYLILQVSDTLATPPFITDS